MVLNGRQLIEILPLSDLYDIYSTHHRLRVFAHKGRECVVCDREGVLLLVTLNIATGSRHVDLYTDDFILMTRDHIIPRALGGKDTLENQQTMCEPCNNSKKDKLITIEEMQKRRCKNGYPQKRHGPELLRQFVGNNNIFNKELKTLQLSVDY